jgi:hypothetical protein
MRNQVSGSTRGRVLREFPLVWLCESTRSHEGNEPVINTQHSVSAGIQAGSHRHDEIEDDHDASRRKESG